MSRVNPTLAPPTQPDRFLRVPEAAERLGVSRRKLWRLLATRDVASVRVGRRGTRISERSLSRFMAKLDSAR